MRTLFFLLTALVVAHPVLGKDRLPITILTLEKDTIRGEVNLPNGFAKGRERGLASVQFGFTFWDAAEKKTEFKPGQVAGFLIWTTDSTYEKYVSATLGPGSSDLFADDASFTKPGMAARFGVSESTAFVHVISETGRLQLFDFYEEEVLEYGNGGIPGPIYNSLNQKFLFKKGSGAFQKLSVKTKKRKKQFFEIIGDCEKVRAVFEKKSYDLADEKIMLAAVNGYNNECR